jgi:hemerythrin-like metal-binding protein
LIGLSLLESPAKMIWNGLKLASTSKEWTNDMKKIHKQYPDWVYNAFPHIYVLVGLAITLTVPGIIAFSTGVALMVAGALLWVLRDRYRRAFAISKGHIDVLDWSNADDPVHGPVQISWRSSFECGHPIMDAQHRRLFGMSNEFSHAVLAHAPKAELSRLLGKFVNQIDQHFSTEHALLAVTQHPITLEHREHHSFLLDKALDLQERFERGEATAREIVGFLVFEVVVDHIANEKLNYPGASTGATDTLRHGKPTGREAPLSAWSVSTGQPQSKGTSTMVYREKALAPQEDWQAHMVNRAAEGFRG